MDPTRRRQGGRGRRSDAGRLAQLPWSQVRNPYAAMEVLTAEQLEAIHFTSLRILEELGMEVMSPRALALLRTAGADVDFDTRTVRIDRGLIDTALRTVPEAFSLLPRNPQRGVHLGGNHSNFGLVAGPPNVHDFERGRRPGNFQDYCDFVRLAQYFNAIHLIGNQVCAPVELPANSRHLDTYRANLVYSDRVFHCTAIGAGRAVDGICMMALARGLSLEEIAASPGVITIISVNSPRRFDEAMTDGLMAMAEHGQAVVITPFTLMGAMAPVSLAAALAQQNAEALFGAVLAQLVRPGTPVMYGAFTSNVDMRSGAPAFDTPENAKANIAGGQLARRYKLPYRTSNASASNAADAQGAYETEMALWGAVLGHGNLVYHAAGWQEGGLTASFEKFILDVEMLQMMIEFLKPIVVNEAELGFDATAPLRHSPGTETYTMQYGEIIRACLSLRAIKARRRRSRHGVVRRRRPTDRVSTAEKRGFRCLRRDAEVLGQTSHRRGRVPEPHFTDRILARRGNDGLCLERSRLLRDQYGIVGDMRGGRFQT